MEQEAAGDASGGRLKEIRGAIEALPEGFALFDDEDRLVFCNGRFRGAYHGLEAMLVPGLSWPIFLAEAGFRQAAGGLAQIDAHLASGVESPLTVEAERPGERSVRLEVRPTDEGGFVIIESDITEERAQQAFRAEADDLMRGVLDACHTNIMMTRIGSGEFIYRNPAWNRLFGRCDSAKQLYENPVERSDFLAELLPTGVVEGFEVNLLRADGSVFPAQVSARVVVYKNEEVIVASIHDMTQVLAQRDEIIRINRRLFDAIEALDQGFVLFDSEHRLHIANQRYHDINAPLAELLRPGVPNAEIVARAEAVGHEPRAAGWPLDAEGKTKEGRRFEFELQDGRAFAASRRVTSDGGFVLAWRDVTDQRAAERELARRREASFQDEKLAALGGLLAGVAHELNNPLSVVVGHAMMLREEIDDPRYVRGIDKISTSAERCAKIVKTFLALARQKPTKLEPTSVNAMIDTALDVASFSLRGATVERRLDVDLPDMLADEDQITQVLINLLVNAGQAVADLGKDARVMVTTRYDPLRRQVEACVADNGPGVPKDLRARIFEPYFTTKGVGEGTGVGLALGHRIVGSHGGRLEVGDSEAGGAAFILSLPRASAAANHMTQGDRPPLATGLTALVVEDEASVGETIVDLLHGFGVAGTLATSAQQGIALLADGQRFDMVLSDLRMPGQGGLDLKAEIDSRWPELSKRMAFITGDAMGADAEAVRQASDRPLLEKPVAPGELYALVRDLAEAGD